MKKIILTAVMIVCSLTLVSAQQGNGQSKKEAVKHQLKKELGLSDKYADSLISVQEIYDSKIALIKSNASLSDNEKKEKTVVVRWLRKEGMKTIVKPSEIDKAQAAYDKIKKDHG